MPTWLKFVLVIVGLLFVLGLLGGIGIWWAMAKLENTFSAMEDELPQIAEEGVAFGQSHDQDQCIDEGLKRAALCGQIDVGCIVKANMFGASCLDAAVPDPTLCADVPSAGDSPFKMGEWAQAECKARGYGDSTQCVQYLQMSVVDYCVRSSR